MSAKTGLRAKSIFYSWKLVDADAPHLNLPPTALTTPIKTVNGGSIHSNHQRETFAVTFPVKYSSNMRKFWFRPPRIDDCFDKNNFYLGNLAPETVNSCQISRSLSKWSCLLYLTLTSCGLPEISTHGLVRWESICIKPSSDWTACQWKEPFVVFNVQQENLQWECLLNENKASAEECL